MKKIGAHYCSTAGFAGSFRERGGTLTAIFKRSQMEDRRRMVQHGFKWQGGDYKGRRAELNPDYVKGECGV